MTPERWRRVEELYYAALERKVGERAHYLAANCGEDQGLRREVESLLEAGDESGRIGEVLADGLSLVDGPVAEGNAPERLGPYRVLREIGRGGLGTVYLAERDDDQYSMQVAIKLVRRGLDTEDILARLRQERQILARLDHPKITRLLDGGSTESGQPYLVMEYVQGTSLGVFCDQQKLGVRQRLRLVIDVCSAVAMAHRNLVIHRDIKPSNVMVTEDGEVKLLDFGIAKLLGRDTEIEPTLPEQRLLTPQYASPEQVQGLPLSTSTDIYSLGAMLYRLLTGASPKDEVGQDGLPLKASDLVVQHRGLKKVAVAEQRGTRPARLRQQLQGDLDNILMKSLAVDPRDRYGSVSEFAEDLRRHLEDQPVRARAPSLAVLWWKFLRRNWLATLAVALIVLSLVLGISATTWQAQRARRAQSEAEQVSTFLAELLEASKPEVSQGEVVPVRSVLDRGAERIATDLVDEPEVQTRLMTTMGQAYFSLGDYDQAAELHRRALAIRRGRSGEDHIDVAESAHALADALIYSNPQEAEQWFVRALAIRRKHLGSDHTEVAETLDDLGITYRRLRKMEEAEEALLEALGIFRRQVGEEHASTAETLNNLGVLYIVVGRFEEAESLLRQATKTRGRLLGEDHPDTLTSMGNLARVLRYLGELDEAETLFRKALAESQEMLGEEHRDVAATLNSLAKVLEAQGDLREAARSYRQAREIYSQALGEDNLSVAKASTNLGQVLLRAESLGESEQAFRQSLAIHRQHPEHPELARTLEALGSLLCNSQRRSAAEPMLREAVAVRRRVHPKGSSSHWRVARAEVSLGACLLSAGQDAEGERLLRSAQLEFLERFGAEHAQTLAVVELLTRFSIS